MHEKYLGITIVAAIASMGLGPHDDEPDQLTLETVDPADWEPTYEAPGPMRYEDANRKYPYIAAATRFKATVFNSYRPGKSVSGRFWLGGQALARRVSPRKKCNGGQGYWYELRTGGYVCDSYGFAVSRRRSEVVGAPFPDVEAPLPFEYARVVEKGALRLTKLPRKASDLEMIEEEQWPSAEVRDEWVEEKMFGDFFLSLDEIVQTHGRRYYRTVRGEFVRVDALDVRPMPPMRGEVLDDKTLPIAFVYGEDEHVLYCGDALEKCGSAEKHARFSARGVVDIEGTKYVKGPEAALIPRDEVRIAKRRPPPDEIPGDDAKWVHFDLGEQTLVAYEGSKPVYATLISSGKPGRDTPDGLYRIKRKYLTKTMRGKDAVEGIYHVEDVPWTMYYYGSYAVHGAYWHNVFGNTRSHGCTNLSPADARWIYNWTDPAVPQGWHAVTKAEGTWFYFTD